MGIPISNIKYVSSPQNEAIKTQVSCQLPQTGMDLDAGRLRIATEDTNDNTSGYCLGKLLYINGNISIQLNYKTLPEYTSLLDGLLGWNMGNCTWIEHASDNQAFSVKVDNPHR